MFRRKIYYQIRKENPIATATDGLEQVYGFSPSPVSLNVPSASGQLKSGHFARRKKIEKWCHRAHFRGGGQKQVKRENLLVQEKSVHNQPETVRLKSTERDERAPTPNWLSEREESAEKGNNGTDRQSSSLQVRLKRHWFSFMAPNGCHNIEEINRLWFDKWSGNCRLGLITWGDLAWFHNRLEMVYWLNNYWVEKMSV